MTASLLPNNLPFYGDLPDPKASKNVRHVLRDALTDHSVMEKIGPYLVNGGICGHKVLDLGAVMDIGNKESLR